MDEREVNWGRKFGRKNSGRNKNCEENYITDFNLAFLWLHKNRNVSLQVWVYLDFAVS
jgi:hypothetical protein